MSVGMSDGIIRKLLGRRITSIIMIFTVLIMIIYFCGALYFKNHYFLHTVINGVDVSLKAHKHSEKHITAYLDVYELRLIERNHESEIIQAQEIGMKLSPNAILSVIHQKQHSYQWINSLFLHYDYEIKDLYRYNIDAFNRRIDELSCLNKNILQPQNARFRYVAGTYEMIEAVYGNQLSKDKLSKAISESIAGGKKVLDLNAAHCYEKPKYTKASVKTLITRKLLNRYVSSMIIYKIGNSIERIDGDRIHRWISVDDDLNAVIDRAAVKAYVAQLGEKYDTVGKEREFSTSSGKTVTIKGGLYGRRIDREAEVKAIINYIKTGDVAERVPVYAQTTLCDGVDDIGNTYVEINITKQHLWFYKDGKLIAEGSVVTGNPNRGNATVLGAYMMIYKQNFATLKGAGYEVEVTYWMPFYGNMGIHDAGWRHSFGGEIYLRNGTHGCVNAPFGLAKKIYENIDVGTPVICYKDEAASK